jgi:hypothetical protein
MSTGRTNSWHIELIGRNLQSFEGIEGRDAECAVSLDVRDNSLTHFYGLPSMPQLVEADFGGNAIASFLGMSYQPKLERLALHPNPVCDHPDYRLMALLAVGPSLREIDGAPVTPAERQRAEKQLGGYSAPLAMLISLGWMSLQVGDTPEDTEYFVQRAREEYVRSSEALNSSASWGALSGHAVRVALRGGAVDAHATAAAAATSHPSAVTPSGLTHSPVRQLTSGVVDAALRGHSGGASASQSQSQQLTTAPQLNLGDMAAAGLAIELGLFDLTARWRSADGGSGDAGAPPERFAAATLRLVFATRLRGPSIFVMDALRQPVLVLALPRGADTAAAALWQHDATPPALGFTAMADGPSGPTTIDVVAVATGAPDAAAVNALHHAVAMLLMVPPKQ